jgi:hypothetical protein
MRATVRRGLILAALWAAVVGAVSLFDWGVARESRTSYGPPSSSDAAAHGSAR